MRPGSLISVAGVGSARLRLAFAIPFQIVEAHMRKIFVSHASEDDGFVRDLQTALSHHGQQVWIDSRELPGANPLWTAIQVAAPPRCAATTRQGPLPGHPLCLNGSNLGVLKEPFGEEPIYVSVRSLLIAVDQRLPTGLLPTPQPKAALLGPTPSLPQPLPRRLNYSKQGRRERARQRLIPSYLRRHEC